MNFINRFRTNATEYFLSFFYNRLCNYTVNQFQNSWLSKTIFSLVFRAKFWVLENDRENNIETHCFASFLSWSQTGHLQRTVDELIRRWRKTRREWSIFVCFWRADQYSKISSLRVCFELHEYCEGKIEEKFTCSIELWRSCVVFFREMRIRMNERQNKNWLKEARSWIEFLFDSIFWRWTEDLRKKRRLMFEMIFSLTVEEHWFERTLFLEKEKDRFIDLRKQTKIHVAQKKKELLRAFSLVFDRFSRFSSQLVKEKDSLNLIEVFRIDWMLFVDEIDVEQCSLIKKSKT